MRVAVTGASGFIGRHVVTELAACGARVVAVTRDAARLGELPRGAGVVEMDIADPGTGCFDRLGSPDVLVHLAWDGLPNYKSPYHFETELPRQYFFIKNLVQGGLGSLVATGTCFEYGMQSGALSEELPPRPTTPYGYAKDALHRQLCFLKSQHPFCLNWARLFYMYGAGQSASSLFPKLKEAALRGDRIFDMSGGEQLRDYLPVTEVARRIVRLALCGRELGTVNICSGEPVSVRALVEKWLRENGWNLELNLGHYPYPDYEPMAFWGAPSVARKSSIFS